MSPFRSLRGRLPVCGRIACWRLKLNAFVDDQNKTFRTRLVAFWLLTNGALVMAIQYIDGIVLPITTNDVTNLFNACNNNDDDLFKQCLDSQLSDHQDNVHTRQGIYFSIILYSTFALSAIRFIGVRSLMLGALVID
jgi:chitin synthase